MTEPLLLVRNLKKHYALSRKNSLTPSRMVRAVDGVHFDIARGEALGLVGESGCGKTTTGRLVLRLTEPTEGEVLFEGKDVAAFSKQELFAFRKKAQIIFQDPYSSLDPRFTVEKTIAEALAIHKLAAGFKARRDRVVQLLEIVGLGAVHLSRYPHEFSGGQRQRIGIARALAVDPSMLVCDEPVSALDVSIQAQVLNLLQELRERLELTYLFISHDLAVVRHVCSRVAVMYLGKIFEVAPTSALFEAPRHPYAHALLNAVPTPDPHAVRRHAPLQGEVPNPIDPPSGCRFHPRCVHVMPECKTDEPTLRAVAPGHMVACHLYPTDVSSMDAGIPKHTKGRNVNAIADDARISSGRI